MTGTFSGDIVDAYTGHGERDAMERPFAPRSLPEPLREQLNEFLDTHDFSRLYKSYSWENDRHCDGFPDIYELEVRLSGNAKDGCVTLDDVIEVALWGKNDRNVSRMKSEGCPLPGRILYSPDGESRLELEEDPLYPVNILQDNTTRVGPTYLSKVLRFALPAQYGAVDTQQVRVFGRGDPECARHDWLDLRVSVPNSPGGAPSIPPKQSHWPIDYGVWIDILRYFAERLRDKEEHCPHPPQFVKAGLRSNGVWACADVEMALFAYASSVTGEHEPASATCR